MSRIPLSDELDADGSDTTDPEFTQAEAEQAAEDYQELDFDGDFEVQEEPYIEDVDSDDD